jgi:hypothetical protein
MVSLRDTRRGSGATLHAPLLALLATVACSFEGNVEVGPPDANPPSDASADAAAPRCQSNNSSLVLCLLFEHQNGATSLIDESQYGNNSSALNATFATGIDMQALVNEGELESQIDESPSLDVVREISMEMWVKPAASVDGHQWLFDNNSQWAMYLEATNSFGCFLGPGGSVSSAQGVIVAGSWQHLACVYDGVTIKLYLNGKSVMQTDFASDLSVSGQNGSCVAHNCLAAGNPYLGQMDTLRVWSRALGQRELCSSANLPDDLCPEEIPDPE